MAEGGETQRTEGNLGNYSGKHFTLQQMNRAQEAGQTSQALTPPSEAAGLVPRCESTGGTPAAPQLPPQAREVLAAPRARNGAYLLSRYHQKQLVICHESF